MKVPLFEKERLGEERERERERLQKSNKRGECNIFGI